MLYAIQQVTAANRRIEQMEAAAAANAQAVPQVHAPLLGANPGSDDSLRVQEYPEFETQFGLPPGADLDAETDAVLRKAEQEARLYGTESVPQPPPGVRPGSPAYRLFREEAYQALRMQLRQTQYQLRDYNEQKRQQIEKLKKEMMSAIPAAERLAESA